jgi:hypothetical protein
VSTNIDAAQEDDERHAVGHYDLQLRPKAAAAEARW